MILSHRFSEEFAVATQPILEHIEDAEALQQLLNLALTADKGQAVLDALKRAASEQDDNRNESS